jgi:MAD (mothers against decapentaplegic) family protein 6/7
LYSVVNLFDDRQLEALADAVENGHHGGRASDCVLAVAPSASSLALPPHIICCRLWRWPALDISVPIKCMPWCQTADSCEDASKNLQQNNRQVCCNPYHWSRLVLPGLIYIELSPVLLC